MKPSEQKDFHEAMKALAQKLEETGVSWNPPSTPNKIDQVLSKLDRIIELLSIDSKKVSSKRVGKKKLISE